jgi:hypothetical protein
MYISISYFAGILVAPVWFFRFTRPDRVETTSCKTALELSVMLTTARP